MEQYFTTEEMNVMYRDYMREKIVEKVNSLQPDSGLSMVLYGTPNTTTIDFFKDLGGNVHVWSYPRIIGSVGTVKIDTILSDIKAYENEIKFVDNLGMTFLWIEPENIKSIGWS